MVECHWNGCSAEATLRYVWAWGEEGLCCLGHRAALEQQAMQLDRKIAFYELTEQAPTTPRDTSARKAYVAPELRELDEVETTKLKKKKGG